VADPTLDSARCAGVWFREGVYEDSSVCERHGGTIGAVRDVSGGFVGATRGVEVDRELG